jgi:hypothetical protein
MSEFGHQKQIMAILNADTVSPMVNALNTGASGIERIPIVGHISQ